MRQDGLYFIVRVWIASERRYWWHELFTKRDWLGVIPGTRTEIWVVEQDVFKDAIRIWPAPPGHEDQFRNYIVRICDFKRPYGRSFIQRCRRRMRRLIRAQVGEQRQTDEWAAITRDVVAYLASGKSVIATPDEDSSVDNKKRWKRICRADKAKYRVRLKIK